MTLAAKSVRSDFDLAVASAYNSELVKQKLKIMKALGLKTTLEDILLTLGDQIHLIKIFPTDTRSSISPPSAPAPTWPSCATPSTVTSPRFPDRRPERLAVLDVEQNAVVIRIVYDGPPEAGKTTSLRALSASLARPMTTPAESRRADAVLRLDGVHRRSLRRPPDPLPDRDRARPGRAGAPPARAAAKPRMSSSSSATARPAPWRRPTYLAEMRTRLDRLAVPASA